MLPHLARKAAWLTLCLYYAVFCVFYSRNVIFTAGDLLPSKSRNPQLNFGVVNMSDVLFVEDFELAQLSEWLKPVHQRHCLSGQLSPYLMLLNQERLTKAVKKEVRWWII